MSRTDHDRPWKIREDDEPWLQWNRILNTETKPRRTRATKRAKLRRYWSRERQLTRLALRNGDEAPARQNAFRVKQSLW